MTMADTRPSQIRWLFSKDLLRDGDTLPATPLLRSIVVAIVCTAVAIGLRFLVDPFVVGVPFVFFFPAILLATLVGGLKAGGLSLALATFASRFFFMVPRWSLTMNNLSDAISLTLFVLAAGTIVAVVHVFRVSIAGHHAALERQRKAERALIAAEQLSNALVDKTPTGFAVVARDGTFVMLNEAFRRAGPADSGKVVGRSALASKTPTGEQVARLVSAVLARGEAIENDEVSWGDPAKPGERRSLLASAFPILGAGGEVSLVGLTRMEITERRRWEQALQFREEHFRLAIEAAELGTWDYDLVNRVGNWSSLAAEMHGLPPGAEPTPETLMQLFDAAAIRAGEAALSGAMSSGEVQFEYRVVSGPATGRRFLSQGRLTRNAQGRPVRVIGIVRDITAERESAERERTQLQMLQGMTNALPQLAWMADAGGATTWLNDRWYAYAGTQPGAEATAWGAALHPDDAAAMEANWADSVRTGAPFEMELRLKRFDGQYRPFLARARAVRGANRRVEQWFGSCTDITELADVRDMLARDRTELERLVAERTAELTGAIADLKREAELRVEAETLAARAKRLDALGQLTGGIAHDFNNFLAAIIAGADLAQRHAASDPERATRELATVKASADKASALVRRLLAFARQQPLAPQSVDANRAIADVEDILRRAVGSRIAIDIAPSEGPGDVTIDVSELESALLNLVANARDAMQDGGRIRIATRLREGIGRVEISVADNGPGIPADVRRRVFEPFFTTKADGKGTGLGLAQVYGFIKQSGGDVELDSTPGSGTTVRLLLPWTGSPAPAAKRADRRPHVLIVEDEALLALSAADELERAGYAVTAAATLKEAEEVVQNGPALDACMVDIGLPDGRGDLWARTVRDRFPLCAIVVSTGYERTERPFSAGDVRLRYLGKPYPPQSIAEAFKDMGIVGIAPADGA